MPLPRVRENTGALLHEIVHVYAPRQPLPRGGSGHPPARQARGNPAFPNWRGPARLAGRGLSGVTSLDALNAVRTPRPLGTVMDEETAYVLAGSFVGFLIERHGLAAFRTLYETGDYERAYDGQSSARSSTSGAEPCGDSTIPKRMRRKWDVDSKNAPDRDLDCARRPARRSAVRYRLARAASELRGRQRPREGQAPEHGAPPDLSGRWASSATITWALVDQRRRETAPVAMPIAAFMGAAVSVGGEALARVHAPAASFAQWGPILAVTSFVGFLVVVGALFPERRLERRARRRRAD